jgi:hypothetical protein
MHEKKYEKIRGRGDAHAYPTENHGFGESASLPQKINLLIRFICSMLPIFLFPLYLWQTLNEYPR